MVTVTIGIRSLGEARRLHTGVDLGTGYREGWRPGAARSSYERAAPTLT
jgi:hypothetical protein